ncbi:pentatricopeptide repeat-containing protein At4g33990-like [Cryptomeria japonica]|uniref:pentatricopeptide repeat-containing protein At4g33990-like n=1 Tax=Cryptomeria japonica TaxID=3369 RepID=UPI0027DA9909|nr:pentatricopeptide repeat-containing protein At4g33990-like [Cryptomeria japonica]
MGALEQGMNVHGKIIESGLLSNDVVVTSLINMYAKCASISDRSRPQTQQIYAMLEKLSSELKAAGYVPDTKLVLNDVEKEEKELFLCHHSEKWAIALGLLHVRWTTIRVVKNLRVCGDSHTATEFISKIVAREIIITIKDHEIERVFRKTLQSWTEKLEDEVEEWGMWKE